MNIVARKLEHHFPGVAWTLHSTTIADWRGEMPAPTPEEIAQLADPPPPPRSWSTLDFIERFPLEKQIALNESKDPLVRLFITKATAAGTVSSNDIRTIQGMAYLVQTGLITQAEHDLILSDQPSP